jgi:outer membrane lipoprotein-sorting protein
MGSAAESFASFVGAVDAWEDRAHSAAAWQRYVNRNPQGSVKPLGGPTHPEDSGGDKRLARVWMAKPWKWRVETSMPAERHLALVIVNSGEWWLSDGASEVATNQGSVTRTRDATGLDRRLIAMLFPDSILQAHVFETLGEKAVAGRRAQEVKAIPSAAEPSCWPTADEVRLVVDHERGVILNWVAYSDGSPYAGMSMQKTEFDQTIAEELFTFTPDAGTRVRRFEGDSIVS